jgi:hypothetical protein
VSIVDRGASVGSAGVRIAAYRGRIVVIVAPWLLGQDEPCRGRARVRVESESWRNVTALESAFAVNSPRLTRHGAALPGWAIHIGVVALWAALFAQVFLRVGAGSWSVGIAYIAYDTLLLAFVMWQTLPMRQAAQRQSASGGPTLGVLIAAYNEASVLPTTLRRC